MKRFKSSRLAYLIARFLIVLFTCPAFALGSGPALAQAPLPPVSTGSLTPSPVNPPPVTVAPTVESRYVAVLPFDDLSHSNVPFLGPQARAAIESAITARRTVQFNWTVLSDDFVDTALRESHIVLPPDAQGIRHLADFIKNPPNNANQAQPVDYIMTGQVQKVDVDRRNHQASVTLEVEVYDATTGSLVNGGKASRASEIGYSTAGEDLLINQALENAAYGVVSEMSFFTLPTGIVMDLSEDKADINLGATSGVSLGTLFNVFRGSPPNEELVGQLKVTDVGNDLSKAEVVENIKGIQTGDHIRQVLTPQLIANPRQTHVTQGHINPWMVAIALVGLVGAIYLINNTSTSSLAAPTGLNAVATELNSNPAVRVTWSSNAPFPVYTQLPVVTGTGVLQNITEYNIYRSNGNPGVLQPAGCTGPTTTTFLDEANLPANVNVGSCTFNQPGFIETNPNTTTTTGTNTTTTTAGTTTTTGTTNTSATIVPLIAGQGYYYFVSRVALSTPGALLVSEQGTTGTAGGLTTGLTGGLTSGLTGGLTGGLTAGLTGGLTSGLTGGLTSGLTGGLTSGLTGGLTAGLTTGILNRTAVPTTREIAPAQPTTPTASYDTTGGRGFFGPGRVHHLWQMYGSPSSIGPTDPPAESISPRPRHERESAATGTPSSRAASPTISGAGSRTLSPSTTGSTTGTTGANSARTTRQNVTTGTTNATTTNGTNTGTNTGQYVESFLSQSAGPVTPINVPSIISPQSFTVTASGIDLTQAVFSWQTVLGANQYVIQVSNQPTFTGGLTYNSPIQTDPSNGSAGGQLTFQADLTGTFPPTAFGQTVTYTLYVRVGARNGTDNGGNPMYQAIPDPNEPLSLSAPYRFIFSSPVEIQGMFTPPGQPTTTGTTTGSTTGTTTGSTTGSTTGPPGPPTGTRVYIPSHRR